MIFSHMLGYVHTNINTLMAKLSTMLHLELPMYINKIVDYCAWGSSHGIYSSPWVLSCMFCLPMIVFLGRIGIGILSIPFDI